MIPSISDNLRLVVAATEAALIADNDVNFGAGISTKIDFRHGNLEEINAQLLEASKSAKLLKKPSHPHFICLFRDFKETLKAGQYGATIEFKAKMGIFTITDPNYNSDEREEKTFKPILRPILLELINQFKKSVAFNMPSLDKLELEQWDCFFYGSSLNKKNQFNNYVDAIEITNISLKLKSICP